MGLAQVCLMLALLVNMALSAPQFAKKSDSNLQKRPFCNAFTGCGRKRSDPSLETFLNELEDDEDSAWNNDQDLSYQQQAMRGPDGQRRYEKNRRVLL